MNESSIKPISGVRPPESGTAMVKSLSSHQGEVAPVHKPAVSEPEVPVKPIESQPPKAENYSNVSIHFRMDDKTNELTVFVVDRKTKRVLRSIPASELHKLEAGELLKLTA